MSVSYSTCNSSLDMLLTYTSDFSDEEMETRASVKRKCSNDGESDHKRLVPLRMKLPLPNIEVPNAVPQEEHLDNPEQHQGRTRTFPHERGNWASFVYVPCELNLPADFLNTINTIASLHGTDSQFYGCTPHISLTKTFVLHHHWIDPFVTTIRQQIQEFSSFLVMFGDLRAYCNEEGTRTFLSVEIKTGYDTLLSLVEILDKSLLEYNLPTFYQDPSFHISVAWCKGNYLECLEQIVPEINKYLHEYLELNSITQWMNIVEHVESSIGNKVHKHYLKSMHG